MLQCDYLNVMDDVFSPDVFSNQYFKFNVTQSSNVPNNIMLFSDVRLGGFKNEL
jgi:hypothetical protein